MKSKIENGLKLTYLLIPVIVIILLAVSIRFLDSLSQQAKPTVTKETVVPSIPKEYPPTPVEKVSDWREYTKSIAKPTIGAEDRTEKFPSPSGKYFVLKITPKAYYGGDYLAVYTREGDYVFGFNPWSGGFFAMSGVAKRFHDYWVNDHTIAFHWDDANYNGTVKAFRYDLDTNQFEVIPDEIFDYDEKGGYLKMKSSGTTGTTDIIYVTSENHNIYVGSTNNRINGISPSGRFILLLSPGIEPTPPEQGVVAYRDVIIAHVEENGLNKSLTLGKVKLFLGGIEGVTDRVFAKWGIDEKSVAVNDFLTESKAFLNPFVK